LFLLVKSLSRLGCTRLGSPGIFGVQVTGLTREQGKRTPDDPSTWATNQANQSSGKIPF
jgi:hypothetical protein